MAIVNREARAELTRAVVERYRGSSKDEKTLILNEFVRLTGYGRRFVPPQTREPAVVSLLAVFVLAPMLSAQGITEVLDSTGDGRAVNLGQPSGLAAGPLRTGIRRI